MIIYPTIEIQNGKCVSLKRGRLQEPAIWHVDPVEKAQEFAQTGAHWMHVTDFNAIDDDMRNMKLIEEIIRKAGIPVQVAGGIRTAERAEYWIDKGAGRVVFGTAAVSQPTMVKHVAQMHADQIVVAVDIYQGKLLTDGWRKESMYEPQDFMHSFADVPLAAFLVTDVGADKAEIEVGASEIAALVSSTRQSVIGSGLVRTIDDISVLKYAGHCDGVLVGRALFNKTVDLSEALRVAAPQKERTAAFV